jgi:sec-independent protein translocase protein TatB
MADLKKSFDEVKEAATGFTGGNIMTSLQKDVGDALKIDDIDKPAAAVETPATPNLEASVETSLSGATVDEASQPAAITHETSTPEISPQPVHQDTQPTAAEVEMPRDAKAS